MILNCVHYESNIISELSKKDNIDNIVTKTPIIMKAVPLD